MNPRKVTDIKGSKFGRWCVLSVDQESTNKVNCRCECGTERAVIYDNISRGLSKSCGCLRVEVSSMNTIHGRAKGEAKAPRAFASWLCMMRRCYVEATDGYNRYGGRGIAVHAPWRTFLNFLEDMGERPLGTTLDRKNNDGNYEPGNCRWATHAEQANNRKGNRILKIGEVEKTLAQWSVIIGCHSTTLSRRIKRGWSIGEALNHATV